MQPLMRALGNGPQSSGKLTSCELHNPQILFFVLSFFFRLVVETRPAPTALGDMKKCFRDSLQHRSDTQCCTQRLTRVF